MVQKVFTADSNNNSTTTFYPGEVIHYMVEAQNTSNTSVTATVTYRATGPQQIYYWSGSASLASGPLRFYSAPTIPTNAPTGTYTITVTITYNGVSSQGQSTFTIATGKAVWCQCTTYVANLFGLPSNYPNAKDWGSSGYLSRAGWKQVSTPSIGDIVVFQPGFGSGIDQTAGHVGIITAVQSVADNLDWQITVEGSNQETSSVYTKANCTNVSNIPFKAYPKSDTFVSYWTR